MYKTYFSPGENCLNAIINQLKKTEKEVKICVFTISDNRISKVLKDIHNNGINVKIITDNDKQFDRGSDIKYLSSKGIEIKIDKTSAHMHHKFAIIDKKITITGSYNWTKSAEAYNYENIIITDQRNITKSYTNEFDKLWDKFIPLK